MWALQRYRSKVRLKDNKPGADQVPLGDAGAGKAALASLGDLCKRFQAKVAEHDPIIRAVFPEPGAALAMLVEFLFEESGIEVRMLTRHEAVAGLCTACVHDVHQMWRLDERLSRNLCRASPALQSDSWEG